MKKYLLYTLFFLPFIAFPKGKNEYLNKMKESLLVHADIDDSEWYRKGDAYFADFESEHHIYDQKIKVSIRPEEMHIRFQLDENDFDKDLDTYLQNTTMQCRLILRDVILTKDKLAAVRNWDKDESDGFEFMEAETVTESVSNESNSGIPHKIINGWDVSIKRGLGKTFCSAKRVNNDAG